MLEHSSGGDVSATKQFEMTKSRSYLPGAGWWRSQSRVAGGEAFHDCHRTAAQRTEPKLLGSFRYAASTFRVLFFRLAQQGKA